MAHYPQIVAKINSQVVHMSYPEPVDSTMWTNRWRTRGKPGDDRWTTWENSGGIHTHPAAVHTGRTAPVHKKWAANWENVVLPRIHSPYYYYVLITQ